MPIDWSRFVQIVGEHRKFVLTSHVRPDCDALGSELGMAGVLESLGKEVLIVNGDETPDHIRFIDPESRIRTLAAVPRDELEQAEVMMVLDTSAWGQLGTMADVLRTTPARKVVVDHHVSEDDLGAETFKDSQAEATGRLVIDAADALGVSLTAEIARPLFAAIVTDTGWLRFSSVTGDSFRAVARLVDAGAEPTKIYSELYEQDTLARILLRGRILAAAKAEVAGRLIYSQATAGDFKAVGAGPSDTEDAINCLLAVAGTEVALLFVELPDGRIKVSLRSRSTADVREVAEKFGGGGHRQAAGASLTGPLHAAQEGILDAARKAVR